MFLQIEIVFKVRTKLQMARWHLYINNDYINVVILKIWHRI